MKKTIAALVISLCAGLITSAQEQSDICIGFVRESKDPKNVVVSLVSAGFADKVHANDILYVRYRNTSIPIKVVFPMMSLIRCEVSKEQIRNIIPGLKVYSTGAKGSSTTVRGRKSGDLKKVMIGSVPLNLRSVAGGKFKSGIEDDQVMIAGDPYWISETEVTNELWQTVFRWALLHKYSFASSGSAGKDNLSCPVTMICWQDAIVWCNAATEMFNESNPGNTLQPCYYMDDKFTVPIRSAIKDQNFFLSKQVEGGADSPFIKPGAKGFRIPTSCEWEYAARYKRDIDGDNNIINKNEFFPGAVCSGVMLPLNNDDWPDDVSWNTHNSAGMPHEVMKLKANPLHLYDMSGNVWEWCFDESISSNGYRITRGGAWDSGKYYLQIGLMIDVEPRSKADNIGFRIVQDQ